MPPPAAEQSDLAEVLVIDDRSTDGSGAVARALGATVIHSTGLGPAAARNLGASRARGDILFFVDADVTVKPYTVQQVVTTCSTADPTVSALFGSYDDEPCEPNFLSQLRTSFITSRTRRPARRAASFWAGCGAIRRAAPDAVGGFDEQRYQRASIEDIELGFRLSKANFQVHLDPGMQVKHLKRWRFFSLIKTEIVDRARPWSTLIISEQRHSRRSEPAVVLPPERRARRRARAGLAVPRHRAGPVHGLEVSEIALAAILISCAIVILLNRGFYLFSHRRPRAWLYPAGRSPASSATTSIAA